MSPSPGSSRSGWGAPRSDGGGAAQKGGKGKNQGNGGWAPQGWTNYRSNFMPSAPSISEHEQGELQALRAEKYEAKREEEQTALIEKTRNAIFEGLGLVTSEKEETDKDGSKDGSKDGLHR